MKIVFGNKLLWNEKIVKFCSETECKPMKFEIGNCKWNDRSRKVRRARRRNGFYEILVKALLLTPKGIRLRTFTREPGEWRDSLASKGTLYEALERISEPNVGESTTPWVKNYSFVCRWNRDSTTIETLAPSPSSKWPWMWPRTERSESQIDVKD